MGFRVFDSPPEIDLPRAQDNAFVRNRDPAKAVGLFRVEHNLFVNQQLVMQRKIVAVGIEAILLEGSDTNVAT